MRRWQIIAILLLVGAGALIVTLPTQISDQRSLVTLLFVGDVMLSRSVGDLMVAKQDWFWPFERIASVTAAADLTFGNLETTISTRGTVGGCTYCFRADPRAAAGLARAGFDVMSVANNHIWDYGAQAFTDTLLALSTSDISYVGGGRDIIEARTGVVRTVNGTRVGYLAYTDLLSTSVQAGPTSPGVDLFDADRMREDIALMRGRADVVIVSFHGGTEYETTHNDSQERIYRGAIDDGADLVIGSHPHVVQEVDHYKDSWIAYSLGNFVFDQNFSPETMQGLMLSVLVEDGRIVAVTQVPIAISRQYQPAVLP
jgi:poly-gamma-glutamate capsule biosynthesis protein CapA/YwtB (metallophosphatase superfamily)